MKTIEKQLIAMFLMVLFSSCNIEVPEEATLNINENGGTQNFESSGYDYEYGDTLGDNFRDHNVYENDQGFYMDRGSDGMQMPPKRPTCHKGSSSSYEGRSVDGGNLNYRPGQSSPWQMSGRYNELLAYGESTNRMIGVMENGIPVYARAARNQKSNIDEHGGTFCATNDFPEGIYHYVIVLNN